MHPHMEMSYLWFGQSEWVKVELIGASSFVGGGFGFSMEFHDALTTRLKV